MTGHSKPEVLIIDDNDVSRSILRHLLGSEGGYKIAGEASNGVLGLQLAERLCPDLICLDVEMQECDGLQVLAALKERWPRMPVLMVTGSKDAQTVQAAMQRGADGYIVKPFYPDTLLRAADNALNRQRG